MHFLLFYDVADDYVGRRGPFRAEHLSLVQKAHDRGELVMAGALVRQRTVTPPAAASISLMDFRPVQDLHVRVIRGHEAN